MRSHKSGKLAPAHQDPINPSRAGCNPKVAGQFANWAGSRGRLRRRSAMRAALIVGRKRVPRWREKEQRDKPDASGRCGRGVLGVPSHRNDWSFRSRRGGCVDKLIVMGFLIVATTLESAGDAIVRMGLNEHSVLPRTLLFLAGTVLLFGYGLSLNLAPLEFGRVVGLYIATLFIVWQIVTFVAFRSLPNLPILLGGALIISGGGIVTFWGR